MDGARGAGPLDFIRADADRPARAGADLALHSLEVMTALLASAAERRPIDLTTTTVRPLPVPLNPRPEWNA